MRSCHAIAHDLNLAFGYMAHENSVNACVDSDGDGTVDCLDGCPDDPAKIDPGSCGCGNLETDPCQVSEGNNSNM